MQQLNRQQQQGFSLFIVMIVMLVIALLVIATNQSNSTEMRMSANEADRKYALSMAESGLRDAEGRIQDLAAERAGSVVFSYDCNGGLCAPVETIAQQSRKPFFAINQTGRPSANPDVAWKREFNGKSIWDAPNKTFTDRRRNGNEPNVQYIIEYLGERRNSITTNFTFRVTSRAHGQNPNTVVMLQSYVELTPP